MSANQNNAGAKIEMVEAKSILSPYMASGWFGGNYNMNIYRGCCHGCIYCDSRSECYGVTDFDTVRAKANALAILEAELRSKRKNGFVITGAMSDGYNPYERELELTRGALKLVSRYGYGAIIHTKSDLVTRDIDLLAEIAAGYSAAVNLTITTADDSLCEKLERNVCVSSKRFEAIKKLSSAGIACGVLLTPILPFVNDTEENISEIVIRAQESGARWVYAGDAGMGGFGVTLRQNQRDYFLEHIDRLLPGMKRRYIRQFGMDYICSSPENGRLWPVFESLCKKLGLAYKMSDIIEIYAPEDTVNDGQVSLF